MIYILMVMLYSGKYDIVISDLSNRPDRVAQLVERWG